MASLVALLALGGVPSARAQYKADYESPPAQWHAMEWMGDCHNCDGTRERTVLCKRGSVTTEDAECEAEPRPHDKSGCPCDTSKPMGADRKTNSFNKSMRNAKTDPCPNLAHKWIAGDWTGCSESACGDSDEAGTQTRTITCAKHVKTAGSDDGSDDGTFDEAESAEMCGPAEKKPPTAHTCGACSKQRPDGLIEVKGRPGHFWKLGAWTECPEGCGSMQTRDVTCVKETPSVASTELRAACLDEDDTSCGAGDGATYGADNGARYGERPGASNGARYGERPGASDGARYGEPPGASNGGSYGETRGTSNGAIYGEGSGESYGRSSDGSSYGRGTYGGTYGSADDGNEQTLAANERTSSADEQTFPAAEQEPGPQRTVEEVDQTECEMEGMAPPPSEHPCGHCDLPEQLNDECKADDTAQPPVEEVPPSDQCKMPDCSGHGKCEKGTCACELGFFGIGCEVQGCKGDEEDCECCPTGVFDYEGKCCDAAGDGGNMLPLLDKDRKCCDQASVDACGVCGGDAVMVAHDGTCCSGEGARLDGRGQCCAGDKTIDHCGVCGGTDDCGAYVWLTLSVKEHEAADAWEKHGAAWNRTQEVIRSKITEASGINAMQANLYTVRYEDNEATHTAKVKFKLPGTDNPKQSVWTFAEDIVTYVFTFEDAPLLDCTAASVEMQCGDGVCAPAEKHHMNTFDRKLTQTQVAEDVYLEDCPMHGHCTPEDDDDAVEYFKKHGKECMGHGLCKGSCECFTGYAGDLCGTCDVGYIKDADGVCQLEVNACAVQKPMEAAMPVSDADPATAPAPAPATATATPEGNDTAPYMWWYSEWGNCMRAKDAGSDPLLVELATCADHNGVQTRDAACRNANNDTVSDDKCGMSKDLETQECNRQPCEMFQWNATEWSECSVPCGNGWRTRELTCVSTFGYPAASEECGARPEGGTVEQCGAATCESAYWTLSAFGACNATCGEFNVMTRNATCYKADTTKDESGAACDGIPHGALEAPCNRIPCESYIWKPAEWQTCLKDGAAVLCGGERTRDVACYNVDNFDIAVDAALCSENSPVARQGCRPCSFCDDVALNDNCSGNGECRDGACACEAGFGGLTCSTDTSVCASGNIDVRGNCCDTGAVMDAAGRCCAVGDVKNVHGECCANGVDGCGECIMAGQPVGKVRDAYGTCCPLGGTLDTQNRCCASGYVDSCGVCDGKDDQCKREVKMSNVRDPTPGRRLSQVQPTWAPDVEAQLKTKTVEALSYPEELVTVALTADDVNDPTATATISLNATAGKEGADNAVTSIGNVTIALVVATNTPPVIEADAPVIEAVPECGDALCSPGEPRVKNQPDTPGLTCEEDCPLMLGQCDAPGTTDLGDSTQPCGGAGFGLCNLATLECECYKGYAGPACNWCDDGYVRNGAACEVQVRLLQDVDDNPAGPDATAGPGSTSRGSSTPVEGDGGSSDDAGLIAGLTLMSVVILAVAGGAFWAFKTGRIGGGGTNSDQYAADLEGGDV